MSVSRDAAARRSGLGLGSVTMRERREEHPGHRAVPHVLCDADDGGRAGVLEVEAVAVQLRVNVVDHQRQLE